MGEFTSPFKYQSNESEEGRHGWRACTWGSHDAGWVCLAVGYMQLVPCVVPVTRALGHKSGHAVRRGEKADRNLWSVGFFVWAGQNSRIDLVFTVLTIPVTLRSIF